MSLPKRDKKPKIKVVVCQYCPAVNRHHSWQCPHKPRPCSYCEGTGHTSLMCLNKPRRPLRQEAEKTRSKRTATSRQWFKLNPPDSKGLWYCYLRISPDCQYKLTRSTITLEHVKPKARYPELKYEVTNLKPACSPCNKLKDGLELHELHRLGAARLTVGPEVDADGSEECHSDLDLFGNGERTVSQGSAENTPSSD